MRVESIRELARSDQGRSSSFLLNHLRREHDDSFEILLQLFRQRNYPGCIYQLDIVQHLWRHS
jgi:hypothetical protein